MKVAVCVPHTGALKAQTAQCLAGMMFVTGSAPVTFNGSRADVDILFGGVGPLDWKRTNLAVAVLDSGSDFLLWIDSDQTFPNDALIRLMTHDKAIVAGNYPSRHTGGPTAFDLEGKPMPRRTGLERAGAVGLGFCLMKTAVLRTVPQPWFTMKIGADGALARGEDVHFCNQARSAGIPVFVDHDLEIGHVAEQVLKLEREGVNADTVQPSPGDQ